MAEEYNKKFPNDKRQPITPKLLIPIIENGSLEEENQLQDLWIKVFENYIKAIHLHWEAILILGGSEKHSFKLNLDSQHFRDALSNKCLKE